MANKKLYKKERFSGCIVGAAAGDALGSPVKTLTISQIKDLYGKKGILKLSPEKRQKTARISDETQMMLFTAHGILWADAAGLRTGEANCADYVFLALQQWLYSQTGGTSSIDLQWILDDNETGFPCDLLGISAFCKKRNPTKLLVQTLAGIKSENDYGRKRRPINLAADRCSGAWKRQYGGLCACHRRILCLRTLRLSQCGTACRKSGRYKRYMRIYSGCAERHTARIFGDSVGICEKAAVCGADKRLCWKDDKSRSKRFYEKIRKRL